MAWGEMRSGNCERNFGEVGDRGLASDWDVGIEWVTGFVHLMVFAIDSLRLREIDGLMLNTDPLSLG